MDNLVHVELSPWKKQAIETSVHEEIRPLRPQSGEQCSWTNKSMVNLGTWRRQSIKNTVHEELKQWRIDSID